MDQVILSKRLQEFLLKHTEECDYSPGDTQPQFDYKGPLWPADFLYPRGLITIKESNYYYFLDMEMQNSFDKEVS